MQINCDCPYCKNNTYIWSVDNNAVWIEIPKNGSYNLKQFRFKFDSRKKESEQISLLKGIQKSDIESFTRGFVILRNPLERFRSLLSHYFINGSRFHSNKGPNWLNSLGISQFNNNDICDIVLDNWQHIDKLSEPHHFNSQSSFIPKEFFNLAFMIYHMDDLSLYFGLQSGINSSDSTHIHISDDNLKRIQTIYEDDFKLYTKYFPKDTYITH